MAQKLVDAKVAGIVGHLNSGTTIPASAIYNQAGIPVIIEPGSHANDQMHSFYFKNPSGFMNEIGWGGRKPTGQSEYYQKDAYGHAPVMSNMKGFMVPA